MTDIRADYNKFNGQEDEAHAKADIYALSLDTFDQIIDDETINEQSFYTLHQSSMLIGNCLGDFIYSKYHDIGKVCIDRKLQSAEDLSKSKENLNFIIDKIKKSSSNFYTKSKKLF